MAAAPTLGELALQGRVIRREHLDEALRFQRQNYLEGDFRRLGEILVDHARCSRAAIRQLLGRQGITVVECELCETRYNALIFRGKGSCLRCGRRLRPSQPSAALTVEDSIAVKDPQSKALLEEYRQRNPRLGRYEILGEVGRGGMGVIYKAWESKLQRYAALKFLRPHAQISSEDRERFRMEARAVAQLRHENIVRAHAIEETGGLIYMAMDFVQGVPMDLLANAGALSSAQIVQVCVGIAQALHYAHGRGIVHRDVKPANVVLDRKLQPYLVDFGIAKNTSETMSLTTEGEVLGSLAYMAPEYVSQGKAALDPRCDVYGLGVVLYETITRGKLPYGDPDDDMMIMRLVKEPPIPIEQVYPGIDLELAQIVNRAIAKDRSVRYADAQALCDDLEGYAKAHEAGGSARFQAGSKEDPFAAAVRLAEETEPRDPLAQASESSLQTRKEEVPDFAGEDRKRTLLQGALGALGLLCLLLALGWGITASKLGDARDTAREARSQAGRAELTAAAAFEQLGEQRKAEAAYTRAIELLPDDPAPLLGRARLLEGRGASEEAAQDREAAARIKR